MLSRLDAYLASLSKKLSKQPLWVVILFFASIVTLAFVGVLAVLFAIATVASHLPWYLLPVAIIALFVYVWYRVIFL